MHEGQIRELKDKIIELYTEGKYHTHGSNGGTDVYGHVYIHGIEVNYTIDTADLTVKKFKIIGS